MKKKLKSRKEYNVSFGYKTKAHEFYNALDDKFKDLAKKFNGENVGSGYGFGDIRDLSMLFKSRPSAERFVKYIVSRYKKRVKAKDVYYTVNKDTPGEYLELESYDGNFKPRKIL